VPNPTTYEKIKDMAIGHADLKALMNWPDVLIEDYLSKTRAFLAISQIIDGNIDRNIEEISTAFLNGSIPFVHNGHLTEDNMSLFWYQTGNFLQLRSSIGKQLSLAYDSSNYSSFETDLNGDLHIYASGLKIFLDDLVTNGFLKTKDGTGELEIDTMSYLPGSAYHIEDGTAQGQVVFWDTASGKWSHTETNEIVINDVDKRIGIGVASPTASVHIKAGTASEGNSQIKFESGTEPSVPEAGTLNFHDDRLHLTNIGVAKIVDRSNDVIISTTTVANTVTETAIYTAVIPGNALRLKNHLQLFACGQLSTHDASDTVTFKLYFGPTLIGSVVTVPKIVTNVPWELNSYITIRTIGSSGTFSNYIKVNIENVGFAFNVPSTAIDTTIADNLVLKILWSSADVGNTIQIDQGITKYRG
jgi:hypothetical protein